MSDHTQERVRDSITALRDAARAGGMDFRERDPHVVRLHEAVDKLAALQRQIAAVVHEMTTAGQQGVVGGAAHQLLDRWITQLSGSASPQEKP